MAVPHLAVAAPRRPRSRAPSHPPPWEHAADARMRQSTIAMRRCSSPRCLATNAGPLGGDVGGAGSGAIRRPWQSARGGRRPAAPACRLPDTLSFPPCLRAGRPPHLPLHGLDDGVVAVLDAAVQALGGGLWARGRRRKSNPRGGGEERRGARAGRAGGARGFGAQANASRRSGRPLAPPPPHHAQHVPRGVGAVADAPAPGVDHALGVGGRARGRGREVAGGGRVRDGGPGLSWKVTPPPPTPPRPRRHPTPPPPHRCPS
jgi:hypothetical protein